MSEREKTPSVKDGDENVAEADGRETETREGKETEFQEVARSEQQESEASDIPDPETLSALTSDQYNLYVRSLLKLLVGEDLINDWICKGNFNILSNLL